MTGLRLVPRSQPRPSEADPPEVKSVLEGEMDRAGIGDHLPWFIRARLRAEEATWDARRKVEPGFDGTPYGNDTFYLGMDLIRTHEALAASQKEVALLRERNYRLETAQEEWRQKQQHYLDEIRDLHMYRDETRRLDNEISKLRAEVERLKKPRRRKKS